MPETTDGKLVTMTEAELLRQVKREAQNCGYLAYHTWTSIHSPKGLPDLVLLRPPRLIFIELKSDRGKLTEAQRVWLEGLVQIKGVEVYLVYPRHLGTIYRALVTPPTEAERGALQSWQREPVA